jgi:hypothetical protein
LTASSPNRALFTFVVIAESSTYWPVLSEVRVPAQLLAMPQSAKEAINASSDVGFVKKCDDFILYALIASVPEHCFDFANLLLYLAYGLLLPAFVL